MTHQFRAFRARLTHRKVPLQHQGGDAGLRSPPPPVAPIRATAGGAPRASTRSIGSHGRVRSGFALRTQPPCGRGGVRIPVGAPRKGSWAPHWADHRANASQ
jgi:hypothetical protein